MQYFISSIVLIAIWIESNFVNGLLLGSRIPQYKGDWQISGGSSDNQLTNKMQYKSW